MDRPAVHLQRPANSCHSARALRNIDSFHVLLTSEKVPVMWHSRTLVIGISGIVPFATPHLIPSPACLASYVRHIMLRSCSVFPSRLHPPSE
jgi:hypothetical protein